MQYIRPPSTTTQFDPVGSIGRGYQTGANIMADIDTTRERKRQEQARNYFGPAVGGDTQSLTKLAQSSPQLAKMAVDVKTYIDQTDNPEELKLTANQMKTMAGAVKAGMAAPDQWPKVQNILAQALNKSPEEIGGVDQAGFYYNMLAGGVGEASKKLTEIGVGGGQRQKAYITPGQDPELVGKPYSTGSAQPYFTPVQTKEGVMSFDARTGEISKPKTTVVKSQDDPALQEELSRVKAKGGVIGKQQALSQGKKDALVSVEDASRIFEKGIHSGFWAPTKMAVEKAIPWVDKTTVANTEEFLSHIGNVVVPRLQEFGGNDSNEELRYLKGIMGGDIKVEEEALRNILSSVKEKIQDGIKRLESGEVEQESTVGRFKIEIVN